MNVPRPSGSAESQDLDQLATRHRRWGAETLIGLAVALFLIPIWRYGSDAGWIGCGSLVNKSGPGLGGDGLADGCELDGAYRRRILIIAAVLVCAGLITARRIWRGTSGRLGTSSRLAACALGAVALLAATWSANNATVAPHPYADIDVEFEPGEVPTIGVYEVTVSADGWTAPTPVLFTTCTSFPDRCDRNGALLIEPVRGSFTATLATDILPTGTVVAVFDEAVSYYAFQRICPADGCLDRREDSAEPPGG